MSYCTALRPTGAQCRLELGHQEHHDFGDQPAVKHETAPVDLVNHPPHYKSGGLEVIDVIEGFGLGYRLGNVVKYVLRHAKKGDALKDLRKARWYLDREISALEKAAVKP